MTDRTRVKLTAREELLLAALPPGGGAATPAEMIAAGKLDEPGEPRHPRDLLKPPVTMTGYHRTYARLVRLGLVQRYRYGTTSPVSYRASVHGQIWLALAEQDRFLRSLRDLDGAAVTPGWLVQVQKLPLPQPEQPLSMQDYAAYHGVFAALASRGLVHPDGRSARGDSRYRLTVKGRERLNTLGTGD